MKPHRNLYQLCLMGALLTAGIACADTLKLSNGTVSQRPIRNLTADGVVTDEGPVTGWADVASVRFDRAPLQAPGQSLILRDGTTLCGITRRLTREGLRFRSISAGDLTVAWTNITAIRYGAPAPFPDAVKLGQGDVLLIRDDQERIQGQVFAATDLNILLRTPDGMIKTSTDTLVWLVAFKTVQPARDLVLVLRNGDRLNGPVTWTEHQFSVIVNGRMLSMDQAAIRGIISPAAATKSKE